jgi:predicted kinase
MAMAVQKPTMVLLIGVSGSGKSYWANAQKGYVVISRDKIRKDMNIIKSDGKKAVGDAETEQTVFDTEVAQIRHYMSYGMNIIIDDTNLSPYTRSIFAGMALAYNYDISIVVIREDLEKCIERRKGEIDPEVIRRQYDSLLSLWNEEEEDWKFPEVSPYSFRYDGTVATIYNNKK